MSDQACVKRVFELRSNNARFIKQVMNLLETETNYLQLDRAVQMRIRSIIMGHVNSTGQEYERMLRAAGLYIPSPSVKPSKVTG